MKNTLKYICMIAIVALAFTSCKKTEQKEEIQHRSTFTASIEDPIYEDEDGNRAYFEPGNLKIKFEPNDVVMLFNLSTDDPLQSHCATYEAVQEGDSLKFQNCTLGEVAEDRLDDGFYAYYPGNIDTNGEIERYVITELSAGENKSKFLVSPCQTYRENTVPRNAMYMAAKVDDVDHLANAHFRFKNICGILRLRPFEAAQRSVTQIEIVDNVFPLTGWVELIMPELDPDEMTSLFNNYDPINPAYVAQLAAYKERIGFAVDTISDYYGNSVTLNCEEAVQLGNSSANTPVFYIVLRPLALSQGFHIIFSFDDGSVKDVDLSSYHSLMIKPNVVRNQGLNLDNY